MKKVLGRNGGIINRSEKGDKVLPGAGRPPGSKNSRTIIREVDAALARGKKADIDDLDTLSSEYACIIQLRRILKSSRSDFAKLAAAQELLNRIFGKIPAPTEEPTTTVENQQINIFLDGQKIDLSK